MEADTFPPAGSPEFGYDLANGKAMILLYCFHALEYPRAKVHRGLSLSHKLTAVTDELPYEYPLTDPNVTLAEKESLIREQFVAMMQAEGGPGANPLAFFHDRLSEAEQLYRLREDVFRESGRELDTEGPSYNQYAPDDRVIEAMIGDYLDENKKHCQALTDYLQTTPAIQISSDVA